MSARAYFGKRKTPVTLTLPDTIPEPDDEQSYVAFSMVADLHKLIFSDPGAGKTLTAIQAMLLAEEALDTQERKGEPRPQIAAVILVPNIAIRTWVRWLAACYDYVGRECVIQVIRSGSDQIRLDTTHVILTYGLVSAKTVNPVVDDLRRSDYSMFIADESHNLTGTSSNRAVTVFGYGFAAGKDALIHNATWKWFLTGTPIPRYNDGLFPVLRACFPHKLLNLVGPKGQHYPPLLDLASFVFVFCQEEVVKFGKMQQARTNICGNRHNELLREILFGGDFPICHRVKLELDDAPIIQEVTIEPKFSKLFQKLEEELELSGQMSTALEPGVRVLDSRMATAMHMMGVECAPEVAHYVLNSFAEDAQRNRAVTLGKVVLYMHTEAGAIIHNTLVRNGLRVRLISGATDEAEDAETERRLNAGECDVVVGQIKAMGVALNLQENCDHVIFAEESFSDVDNLQAYQRVWRRGQKRKVRVDICRPMSFLADMKVVSADKKRAGASEVLDGKASADSRRDNAKGYVRAAADTE